MNDTYHPSHILEYCARSEYRMENLDELRCTRCERTGLPDRWGKLKEPCKMTTQKEVRQAYVSWQVAESKVRNWNGNECSRLRFYYYQIRDQYEEEHGKKYEDE